MTRPTNDNNKSGATRGEHVGRRHRLGWKEGVVARVMPTDERGGVGQDPVLTRPAGRHGREASAELEVGWVGRAAGWVTVNLG